MTIAAFLSVVILSPWIPSQGGIPLSINPKNNNDLSWLILYIQLFQGNSDNY